MTPTEKAVEAMAERICLTFDGPFDLMPESGKRDYREQAKNALAALISRYPGIASVIEGTGMVVPRETSPEMWTAGAVELEKWRTVSGYASKNDAAILCYRAMLAAAEGKE